jgi:two-component system LytT family response regulator
VRCESYRNYTEFNFADGKKMISSRNLGFYEALLPPGKFCRIHQSHLVNIDFIDKYNKRSNGGTITMKDGKELDVSQRRKETLFNHVLNK